MCSYAAGVMTQRQSVSWCEQRSVGGRRFTWGGVNGSISHLGVYQQVHHRLGMDKYGLLHTEAVFWRMRPSPFACRAAERRLEAVEV